MEQNGAGLAASVGRMSGRGCLHEAVGDRADRAAAPGDDECQMSQLRRELARFPLTDAGPRVLRALWPGPADGRDGVGVTVGTAKSGPHQARRGPGPVSRGGPAVAASFGSKDPSMWGRPHDE